MVRVAVHPIATHSDDDVRLVAPDGIGGEVAEVRLHLGEAAIGKAPHLVLGPNGRAGGGELALAEGAERGLPAVESLAPLATGRAGNDAAPTGVGRQREEAAGGVGLVVGVWGEYEERGHEDMLARGTGWVACGRPYERRGCADSPRGVAV